MYKVTLFICIYLLFFKKDHYFKPAEDCDIKLHPVYFKVALSGLRQFLATESPLTLIWEGSLGVCFEVGGKITPCQKLVNIMLET